MKKIRAHLKSAEFASRQMVLDFLANLSMHAKRRAVQEAADRSILAYLSQHHGQWLLVNDVANGTGLSIRAVSTALARLAASRIHNVEAKTVRKKINGKQQPCYRLHSFKAPSMLLPRWLNPLAPVFDQRQIISIRTHKSLDDDD